LLLERYHEAIKFQAACAGADMSKAETGGYISDEDMRDRMLAMMGKQNG